MIDKSQKIHSVQDIHPHRQHEKQLEYSGSFRLPPSLAVDSDDISWISIYLRFSSSTIPPSAFLSSKTGQCNCLLLQIFTSCPHFHVQGTALSPHVYLSAGCGIVYYFLLLETFSSFNHFFFGWFLLIPLPSKHRKLFPIIIHFRHLIYSHGLKYQLYMEPEGGHGNPLQYSCLGNPMNRRAW